MKKILMMILCLALMLGCAQAEIQAAPGSPMEAWGAPAPGAKLGLELLSMLHVSGENTVLSPQSLALALALAAEGAQGETLAQILAALGAEDASEISAVLPEGIQSANAAFTAPYLSLKQAYLDRLNEAYDAQQFELDAEVVEKVNAWVQQHTGGLIDEMLTRAPGTDIALMLLNAVAMDAEWTLPFDPAGTAEEIFHTAGGDVTVQMMHQTAHFDYAEKDGMQIVRLPYQQGNLEMWIVLPPEGGMHQLLEILANDGLFYLESDAESREVILSLPKVDAADDHSLGEALQLLGIEAAFTDAADFSGISDVPLCIDEVIQKSRIQIDEEGTKAAAATLMMMRWMSARPDQEPVEMNINRPFAFVIADHENGSICFAGAIENPVQA